jgi:hypothetical protein
MLSDDLICSSFCDLMRQDDVVFAPSTIEYLIGFFPVGMAAMLLIVRNHVPGISVVALELDEFLASLSFCSTSIPTSLNFSPLLSLTSLLSRATRCGVDLQYHSIGIALANAVFEARFIPFASGSIRWKDVAQDILSERQSRSNANPHTIDTVNDLIQRLSVVKVAVQANQRLFADPRTAAAVPPSVMLTSTPDVISASSEPQHVFSAFTHMTVEHRGLAFEAHGIYTPASLSTTIRPCPECKQSMLWRQPWCRCGFWDRLHTWTCSKCNLPQSTYNSDARELLQMTCRNAYQGCPGKRSESNRVGASLNAEDEQRIRFQQQFRARAILSGPSGGGGGGGGRFQRKKHHS